MSGRPICAALALVACLALAGCGARADERGAGGSARTASATPKPGGSLDDALRRHPRIGLGPRHRPGPGPGPRAGPGRACRPRLGRRVAAHVELFADRTVILLPPGVGTGAPRRVTGAYLRGARCYGPLVTLDPTGVVLVRPGAVRTVGDLFAAWGRPLGPRRLLSFRGRVRAYAGAHRWTKDVRLLPLGRHAQVTLQVGAAVRPHARYRFPRGR
ncbi:MAG TPA: hypothetical protein VL120_13130 [Solirubrobacteraceae bacterium]|nr:hypothetical protein [Solirubrobacteraceae bacterium]